MKKCTFTKHEISLGTLNTGSGVQEDSPVLCNFVLKLRSTKAAPNNLKFCHWFCSSNNVNKQEDTTSIKTCTERDYPLGRLTLYVNLVYMMISHLRSHFRRLRRPRDWARAPLSPRSRWTAVRPALSSRRCRTPRTGTGLRRRTALGPHSASVP